MSTDVYLVDICWHVELEAEVIAHAAGDPTRPILPLRTLPSIHTMPPIQTTTSIHTMPTLQPALQPRLD